MKKLSEWKPALWGAVGGAIVLAVLGFTVLGWTTGGTAAKAVKDGASAAVVSALSPICVSQFNADANSAANLELLKAERSYNQSSFVEKGGWATMPGSEKPVSGVAKNCATLLVES